MDKQIKKLVALIKILINASFYGKLEITFNAGKIINLKKEESIKLD